MAVVLIRLVLVLTGCVLLLAPLARALSHGEGAGGMLEVLGHGGWADPAGGAALIGLALLGTRQLARAAGGLRRAWGDMARRGGLMLDAASGEGGLDQAGKVRAGVAAGDCLLIAAIAAAAFLPWIARLGFYSDDWSVLSRLSLSGRDDVAGLFRALVGSFSQQPRPLHMLYTATLYRLFGLAPLGYHLVNAAVIVAGALLLYLVLRELRQARLLLIAVPLVYVLMPQYGTDRLWLAAFQAPLSVLAYLVSLYADLRGIAAGRLRFWAWKLVSVLGFLASVLAYEIAAFLFLLNPGIAYLGARQAPAPGAARPGLGGRIRASALIYLVLIGAAAAFKFATSDRVHMSHGALAYLGRQVYVFVSPFQAGAEYGLNLWKALYVDFVEYGIGLPGTLWVLLRGQAAPARVGWALALGLVVFACVHAAARREPAATGNARGWAQAVLAGLVVFLVGYATFLATPQIILTPTGIGNRVSMAAALGAALALVGAIGWLAAQARSGRVRAAVLAALVGFVAGSGVLIDATIAGYWSEAAARQAQVLAAIRAGRPTLPRGAVVLLDGVCPYVGPGIVFETYWDMTGALQLIYRDPTLKADVVTDRLTVGKAGIETSIYGERKHYAYGKGLIVYDARRRHWQALPDEAAARAYFAAAGAPGAGCPAGREGVGVPIL